MTQAMTASERFFYEQAGWSYDPARETPEQGRERCSRWLAQAEQWATGQMCFCMWMEDDYTRKERGRKRPYHACIMLGPNGRQASLWAIDLKTNWQADPYRRVVEAELALELIGGSQS